MSTNRVLNMINVKYLKVVALGVASMSAVVVSLDGDDSETILNWSCTHHCTPKHIYLPESEEEVREIIAKHHRSGEKLRVVGSALSPNGIGLTNDSMINLASMDHIKQIDKDKMEVTVEPGIKVGDLCKELEKVGLSLENLASIADQQVGGFIQVGAHGTGAAIPPVDMQVTRMKLMTPGLGLVELSSDKNAALFELAKVGLGCLGIVTEVTLRVVPAHNLLEHTFTVKRDYIKLNHAELLSNHRHIRYMWIPHTDKVVVVTNDPVPADWEIPPAAYTPLQATEPLRQLLKDELRDRKIQKDDSSIDELSFAQLRDELIVLDPLNPEFIKKVNEAEARFWERSESYRIDKNVNLLQFECGGQQWVSEIALPAGSLEQPTDADVNFMCDLLDIIERDNIAAPSPIEQRWTSNSSSLMSPAHATQAQRAKLQSALHLDDTLHSWVGIIMYLPTDHQPTRQAITDAFFAYKSKCMTELWPRYDAHEHWAKIEVPNDRKMRSLIQKRLGERYPLTQFSTARQKLDPKAILTPSKIEELIPFSK